MITDKRVDAIFRKQYHLKGSQVKHMQSTLNYQATLLKFLVSDLLKFIFKK